MTSAPLGWIAGTSKNAHVNAVAGLDGPSPARIGDGFSDLINRGFGEAGTHAQATIGATSLAFNVPTISEATAAIDNADG